MTTFSSFFPDSYIFSHGNYTGQNEHNNDKGIFLFYTSENFFFQKIHKREKTNWGQGISQVKRALMQKNA